MPDNYILDDDNNHIPEEDILTWAKWMQDNRATRCIVKQDTVGSWRVSTVFMGTDHAFVAGEPPVLYETMVFGGPMSGEQDRYYTWELAEAGHEKMVERVKSHTTEVKLSMAKYIAQAWCPDGVMRRAQLGGSPTQKHTDAIVMVGGISVKGSCHKGKVPDDYPKPPSTWTGWYFYPLTGPGAEVMGYTVENRLEQEYLEPAGDDPGEGPEKKGWEGFDFDDDQW